MMAVDLLMLDSMHLIPLIIIFIIIDDQWRLRVM